MVNSRRKGHDFERYVAKFLRTFFLEARRGLQYDNPRECDVEGTPFRIECKRLRDVAARNIVAALMQAKGDGERHNDPRPCIAITKADNREALVHMTLDTFGTIVEKHFYRPTPDAEIIPFPTKENA